LDQFQITDGWILGYKNASVPQSHREATKEELKLLSWTIHEAVLFMPEAASDPQTGRLSEIRIYMNENELRTMDNYLLLKFFSDSVRGEKGWDCDIYRRNHSPRANNQLVGRIAKG